MKNDLWQLFTQTGSVNDYLTYKNNENIKDKKAELSNADNNQRFDNKRTDNWGE